MTAQKPFAFISHSSKDKGAFVLAFAEQLGAAGIDTFVDVEDIDDGARWVQVIQQGVEDCAVMVVVWSANAKLSAWVEREVLLAFSLNKPVLIALIDDTPLTLPLISLQATDCRHAQTQQIRKLAKAIQKLMMGKLPAPVSPSPGPGEHNFFKFIEQLPQGARSAQVARSLFAFGNAQANGVNFSGRVEPVMHVNLWVGAGGVVLFSVRAYPKQPAIEVPMLYWTNFAPYDQRAERVAVLRKLNELMPKASRFTEDRADLRPNLPINRALATDDQLQTFQMLMSDVIAKLRAAE